MGVGVNPYVVSFTGSTEQQHSRQTNEDTIGGTIQLNQNTATFLVPERPPVSSGVVTQQNVYFTQITIHSQECKQ